MNETIDTTQVRAQSSRTSESGVVVVEAELDEEEVHQIARTILRSNVNGKLFPDIKFHSYRQGKLVDVETYKDSGYYDHGPDEDLSVSSFQKGRVKPYSFLTSLKRAAVGEYEIQKYVNHYIVFIEHDSEKGVACVAILFFQDEKIPDYRGGYTPAFVVVEMPSPEASNLEELIKQNPDLLETFYQESFPKLDDNEQDDVRGIRRVKAPGFYVLHPDDFSNFPEYLDASFFENFFNEKQCFEFEKGPYGVGQPFGTD